MSDIQEWYFPDIFHEDNDFLNLDYSSNQINYELFREKGLLKKEIEAVKLEKNRLKSLADEYNTKLEKVKSFILDLEQSKSFFDEEMKNILTQFITEVVIKITKKSINQNPELIESLIDDIKNQITKNDLIQSIQVSAEDIHLVEWFKKDTSCLCEVNQDLVSGDLIVHTNVSSVCTTLRDRVISIINQGST